MNDMKTLATEGEVLRAAGQHEEALEKYSKAFDVLIDEAGLFARSRVAPDVDPSELRDKKEILFAYSKDFLKQSLDAAILLNTMGELFAELGDYDNARQKMIEAQEFIPDGAQYDDPLKNLEQLASKQMNSIPLEELDA